MLTLSLQGWQHVGNLGAAALMLPMLIMMCAALWQTGQGAAAGRWLLLLAAGSVLVLTTKLVFLVWGLGSVAFDFSGISGHATLATAILPVWLAWLPGRRGRHWLRWVALLLGLGVGALVGWSRVVVGEHSVSEVAAGWVLGAVIAVAAFRCLAPALSSPWLAKGAGLILLLALTPFAANALPTHKLEARIAKALSPTGALYRRTPLPPRVWR